MCAVSRGSSVQQLAAISSSINVLAPDVYGSPPPEQHSPPLLSLSILPPSPILLSSPVSSGLHHRNPYIKCLNVCGAGVEAIYAALSVNV